MYLNCHSWFSLKYGTLSIDKLLETAKQKGVHKFVLTDINNTSGVLSFVRLAKKYDILPVVGIDFRNGVQQQFVGIAQNNIGFQELNQYLSVCSVSGVTIVPDNIPVFENCFIILPFQRFVNLCKVNENGLLRLFNQHKNIYIGISRADINQLRFSKYTSWQKRMVVMHTVSFLSKTDFNIHRLLRAIDHNILLSKLVLSEQGKLFETMLPYHELLQLYSDFPTAVLNTQRLLEQCSINFDFGVNQNKKHFCENAEKDNQLLRKLCYDNLTYRYHSLTQEIFSRLEKELSLIQELNFSAYFLINYDIVRYARNKNYFYIGRGSGANSLVAYLLRITDVDPVELDLYFERFLNPYRTSPPDFDLDFSWKDRDDVIQYIFNQYSPQHTCLLATYNTFQYKGLIRELGKVFGLPKNEIDALYEKKDVSNDADYIIRLIGRYSSLIHDFPNYLSIHSGGILISEKPIYYYTAFNYPPKGFPTCRFSMIEAEDVGLYKFDILSQRGLGHIKDAIGIIRQNRGVDIDIHDVKSFKQDEQIKVLLRQGRCMGCFYVESPAMRMLLKKLKADTYKILVAASSIIRPGVASSGMMTEYILRYRGKSSGYETPSIINEILEETFGVMVYQEDVIKVAHSYAGLGLAEADILRRGMSGKYRSRAEFERVKQMFFDQCKAKGYAEKESAEVWRQIESFAGYAFSKGHSASYAVESYMSLFLKAYYPLEHMVAVVNNFGGFYQTEHYLHEARQHGALVIPPHINKSNVQTTIEGTTIYLGFNLVAGLEQKTITDILQERKYGCFVSLIDFNNRVNITIEQLQILIRVGAFNFTGRKKRELLWDIHITPAKQGVLQSNKIIFEEYHEKYFNLPELYQHPHEDALDEIELLGFPLCNPFILLENAPSDTCVVRQFPEFLGKNISIKGYLITVKRTRTKHKEEMFFATFIDVEGNIFDTTHFPLVARKYPMRGRGCYLIKGIVTVEFDFYSIMVQSAERLPQITF